MKTLHGAKTARVNASLIVASMGDRSILSRRKTAFLCSRRIPAAAVLRCYDWAVAQRDAGKCVISAFHSRIEKDVFHYLLAGTQPVIMALARGMKTMLEPDVKSAVDSGRLLIITPFGTEVTRITAQTADIRNRFMVDLADELVVGYTGKNGLLDRLVRDVKNKPVSWLLEAREQH